jgi:hypothetical protein
MGVNESNLVLKVVKLLHHLKACLCDLCGQVLSVRWAVCGYVPSGTLVHELKELWLVELPRLCSGRSSQSR